MRIENIKMINPSKVPVFILAGGLGTRISEETHLKPKPMIEIGNIPILVHIMRWYYSFGFNDFVICAGYRAWDIKDYFLTYQYLQNHLIIDHRESFSNQPMYEGNSIGQEKWRVRVLDTGLNTMTGARIAQAYDYVNKTEKIETFAVTYGDGLSNVNLLNELEFHSGHKQTGTLLGVPPFSRFGEMEIGTGGSVKKFLEKPESKQGLINGGFFFFNKEFRNYLSLSPQCVLEREPIEKLTKDGKLTAFEHRGFWQCMDTLRDKNLLQNLWDQGSAPWSVSK